MSQARRSARARHGRFGRDGSASRPSSNPNPSPSPNPNPNPDPNQVCLQTERERSSKWANFGPYSVDLGAVPPRGADRRVAAHGMDVAQMFERLWFVIFDPLELVRVRVLGLE